MLRFHFLSIGFFFQILQLLLIVKNFNHTLNQPHLNHQIQFLKKKNQFIIVIINSSFIIQIKGTNV